VYRIFWKNGDPPSLAAVGRGNRGRVWLAPCDWDNVPSTYWLGVARVEPVEIQVPRTPVAPEPTEARYFPEPTEEDFDALIEASNKMKGMFPKEVVPTDEQKSIMDRSLGDGTIQRLSKVYLPPDDMVERLNLSGPKVIRVAHRRRFTHQGLDALEMLAFVGGSRFILAWSLNPPGADRVNGRKNLLFYTDIYWHKGMDQPMPASLQVEAMAKVRAMFDRHHILKGGRRRCQRCGVPVEEGNDYCPLCYNVVEAMKQPLTVEMTTTPAYADLARELGAEPRCTKCGAPLSPGWADDRCAVCLIPPGATFLGHPRMAAEMLKKLKPVAKTIREFGEALAKAQARKAEDKPVTVLDTALEAAKEAVDRQCKSLGVPAAVYRGYREEGGCVKGEPEGYRCRYCGAALDPDKMCPCMTGMVEGPADIAVDTRPPAVVEGYVNFPDRKTDAPLLPPPEEKKPHFLDQWKGMKTSILEHEVEPPANPFYKGDK
jgi:hypothetical protein